MVAIFRSLEGESLEDYSVRLAEAWRVGQKGLDNGVIFLVFLEDRKMRIEVGYGLEGMLTDAMSAAILARRWRRDSARAGSPTASPPGSTPSDAAISRDVPRGRPAPRRSRDGSDSRR